MKYINLFLFLLFFGIIFGNFTYGANYILPNNSVDESEIRWGGTTKYNLQWNNAISMWHNYGVINILPDNSSTYEDLRVSDVKLSSVGRSGIHSYNPYGTDTIKLNTFILDGLSSAGSFSSSNVQHTIGHELGHALGLAHHNLTGNVLRSGKWSYITLGTQDKLDYDYLW